MIKIAHQNQYAQKMAGGTRVSSQKECMQCEGNGWIYEFYNDPVSWRTCPECHDCQDEKETS